MSRVRVDIIVLVFLASAVSTHPLNLAHAQSPTFTMTASPAALTFPTGSSATSTITITSQNGFSGMIGLSGESFPYQQVSVALNPTSVYVPANGTAQAIATLSATSTTTPYNYTIDINANGGVETAFLYALVTPGPTTVPDFRLSANPDPVTVPIGTTGNTTITVASLDNFAGDIVLQVYFPPSHLNATVAHLSSGGIIRLTLTIPEDCPSALLTGPDHVTIDVNSATLHHWLDVTVFLTSTPIFCFRPDTDLVSAVAGSSTGTQFNIIGFDGFNDTVTITTQSSFQVTILRGTIAGLAELNRQQFNILVYVPTNTPPGNHTVTVTGTSATTNWSANVTVQTTIGPYYDLSASPASLTIPRGSTATATISLTGANGFNRNDVDALGPIVCPVSKPVVRCQSFPYLPGLSANITALSNVTPYGFGVYSGVQTNLKVVFNASLTTEFGDYFLIFGITTVYSPYVNNYAIFRITVPNPLAPIVTINSVTPNPAHQGTLVTVYFSVTSPSPLTSLSVDWGDKHVTLPGLIATSDTYFYLGLAQPTQTLTIKVTAINKDGQGVATVSETVIDVAPTVTITGFSPNPAQPGQQVTLNFTASDIDGTVGTTWVNWGDGSTPDLIWNLESSSMCVQGSTLCPGSLLLFRPQNPDTITVGANPNGTIIIFRPPCCGAGINDPNYLVVHRVVGVGTPGVCGALQCFITKGDHNYALDPWDSIGVPPSNILGVYQATLSTYSGGGFNPIHSARFDTHTYNEARTFTITVNATDDSGSTTSTTLPITVGNPQGPSSPQSPSPNQPQTILGLSPTLFYTILAASVAAVAVATTIIVRRRPKARQ